MNRYSAARQELRVALAAKQGAPADVGLAGLPPAAAGGGQSHRGRMDSGVAVAAATGLAMDWGLEEANSAIQGGAGANAIGMAPDRWRLSVRAAVVGLYKLNPVETHSLKAPGFNP